MSNGKATTQTVIGRFSDKPLPEKAEKIDVKSILEKYLILHEKFSLERREFQMNSLNYKFFEEFKHLDKLCGEIYKTEQGITHYIDDMKSRTFAECHNIQGWSSDLNQLLRLRHIRNKMAHEENAFDDEDCTQTDIDWVRGFYNRIINQTDPLAELNKENKTVRASYVSNAQIDRQIREKSKKHNVVRIFLLVLIAAALTACLIGALSTLVK
ncbi:MAG: hypothetical protein NC223_09885 [Butyrivibrio sp.]|nr:hypothetical protein [Butyrivibrio sp.]